MVERVQRTSAQVTSSVTDLSQISIVPERAFFACVTATKGELNTPYLCETPEVVESILGKPNKNHIGLIAAYKVISEGIPGYLVRVASENLASAKAEVPGSEGTDPVVEFYIKQKGSDGNEYSLSISETEVGSEEFTISLSRAGLVLETITVSNDDSADNFVLDLDHEVFGVNLVGSDYSSLASGDYEMQGGDDGVEGITAEDYIGVSFDGNLTGAHVFLRKDIKGNFFGSFGYTDKAFYSAMKDIADRRKDLTCIFDPPLGLTKSKVIDWLEGTGSYEDTMQLYGIGWNCEIYWDWLRDTYGGENVILPPSAYVILNSMKSFDLNGPWFPVAGSSRGVVKASGVVTKIPEVVDRNDLVTHSINPIYDTGYQGIQIYGNETLNTEYSDLSAAHIARTLTYIRSTIDEYTESKKFELNDMILWSEWVDHVQDRVLAPIKDRRGLQWYRATMGASITSPQELAQRRVRGRVELQFTPDAEVFILDYVVHSSAGEMEE